MTEVRCLGQVTGATELRVNVASVKSSTATSKALQAKHLEQTGGDMRIYDSSASASFAAIDVKSQVVTSDGVCSTFAFDKGHVFS